MDLGAARAALEADLVTAFDDQAVRVYGAWPDRPQPPCVLVTVPVSGPWLSAGQTFGTTHELHLDCIVLVPRSLATLEELTAVVLANTVDWSLSGVDSPTLVTLAGVDFLGTTVHLSQSIKI
jgi:hypothetical protein